MRPKWSALLAAAALVVVVAAGFAAWRWNQGQECAAVTANVEATGVYGSGEPRVAVVGDSWATGWGLDNPAHAWPASFAERTSSTVTVDGVPGTGYVEESACGRDAFRDRLPVPDADVVIVAGGVNDLYEHANELREAAVEYLTAVREDHPRARLVVVGVPRTDEHSDDLEQQANIDLAVAAATVDGQFIDPTGWSVELGPDGLHPTRAGHEAFARSLADALGGDSLSRGR